MKIRTVRDHLRTTVAGVRVGVFFGEIEDLPPLVADRRFVVLMRHGDRFVLPMPVSGVVQIGEGSSPVLLAGHMTRRRAAQNRFRAAVGELNALLASENHRFDVTDDRVANCLRRCP